MSGEFDAQHVLEAVDSGQVSPQWRIYRARRLYFYGEALLSLTIAAIIAIVPALFLLALVTTMTQPPSPESIVVEQPDTNTQLLLGALMLVCIVTVAVFIGRAIVMLKSSWSAYSQVLVLTPEGFVARTRISPPQMFAVPYADLAAVAMSVTHSRYESIIRLNMAFQPWVAGLRTIDVPWRVDPRFGAQDIIAQAIIQDHARYKASRGATII